MATLIDTYNCTHAGLSLGGAFANLSVRSLCQWITGSPSRTKTTLVLDGRPKPDEPSPNEFPDLHLVYSGAGVSADTVIAQLVQRSHARKHLTVVTNDRAVQSAARRAGATPQSCEAYLQSLLTAHNIGKKLGQTRLPAVKTQGQQDKALTDRWLKEFGLNPEDTPGTQGKSKSPQNPDNLDMKNLMGF